MVKEPYSSPYIVLIVNIFLYICFINKSGQVRVFNVHIQNKLSGTGKERGGGGNYLHWRVQGSTSSPTGVGSRGRVLRCYGIWNVP